MTGSAKQSILQRKERMDCFASLAMTMLDVNPRSRGADGARVDERSTLDNKGRRECRVPEAPASRAKDGQFSHGGHARFVRRGKISGSTAVSRNPDR
jgi:hypothetical protein